MKAIFFGLALAFAVSAADAGATAAVRLARSDVAVPDVVLGRDILSVFANDAWLKDHRLGVQVRNGVAELSGDVDSAHERLRAAQRAAAVPGVVSVVNRIRVRTARTHTFG